MFLIAGKPIPQGRLPFDARVEPPHLGLAPGSAMARHIPARSYRRTMPGWFPTSKSEARILRVETILELDGVALFEVDPAFVQLATQPHELRYSDPNRGWVLTRYFPDLIALRSDGQIVVVDFKNDADARSSRWRARSAIVSEIYQSLDVMFVTLSQSVVRREPRFSNHKLLLRHRPSGSPIDLEAEAMIWRRLGANPVSGTPLGELLGRDNLAPGSCAESPAFTTFAQLVLKGHLAIDLNQPITPESIVRARRQS